MSFFVQIIIIVIVVFMVDLFAYKYIRKLDKNERIKLRNWENVYIKELEAKVQELEKND